MTERERERASERERGNDSSERERDSDRDRVRPLVAIAGNPNTGKTTLFNALTGSRAKIGNYPGVTVDRRVGQLTRPGGGAVDVLDIPGTYSLLARTGEEQIALEAMVGLMGQPRPDAVVICVDATGLSRSAYLVVQAQELGLRVIVALTMMDDAGDAAPDPRALERVLGCDVVAVVARRRIGLDSLRSAIDRALAATTPPAPVWRWTPSAELADRIAAVRDVLPPAWPRSDGLALWALMSVEDGDELQGIGPELRAEVARLGGDGAAIDDEVIAARYAWLDASVAPLTDKAPDRSLTDRIDSVLIHRVAGFGVFLAIMFVVFQSLFAWADPAITLIEDTFAWLGELAAGALPEGIFAEFVVNGLIAGVGSVLVFLPQILLLFFFIGLMEDSGYLARVAYLMDRIMKSMNLHGRAFIPMLSGFACAVPAVLATRTMERRRDRLLTMMVVPLMTCSARLPVYTLVIAALFPAGHVLGVFPVQGLLMVAMYLFSTVTALAAAWVLSRAVKPLRAVRLPFVIELPPYRRPRLRDVTRMMWERTRMFLSEAGTVILACTIVLWALLSFPRTLPESAPDYDAMIAQARVETRAEARAVEARAENRAGEQAAAGPAETPAETNPAEAAPAGDAAAAAGDAAARVKALEREKAGELLRNSYGGRLGHAIEPAIEPLGFDWKVGIGIIGAFAAREVFVSTMGVVYSAGADVDENSPTLRDSIRAEVREDGRRVFTPLMGLSLMVFFALACQCMSTLAVVKRETGGYRWPLFLFTYMTSLAWVMSFLVYQGGRLLGFE